MERWTRPPAKWMRACSAGAGPAGAAAAVARAPMVFGVDCDRCERYRDVGGLRDIEIPATPMCGSTHFISSMLRSAFLLHPMHGECAIRLTRLQVFESINTCAYAVDSDCPPPGTQRRPDPSGRLRQARCLSVRSAPGSRAGVPRGRAHRRCRPWRRFAHPFPPALDCRDLAVRSPSRHRKEMLP